MYPRYDVLIVGSGASGLFTALHLRPDCRVLLLSKQDFTLSNSSLAQGGVASVFDTAHDKEEFHVNDTMIAGGFRNRPAAVNQLVHKGPDNVRELFSYDVDFDRNEDGSIHLTLEGGHCRPRILHHKDATGAEIVKKLLAAVQKLPNVTMVPFAHLCDLKQTAGGFSADILKDGAHRYVTARYCVLATGGIGRVYEYTTNSAIATGDGIALAYRMGATIRHLHYVQFHPTAFANKATRECFLISESVRGEGAYLLNGNGERFMHKYDDRLELAPRDVVSQSIMREEAVTGSRSFYLDITHKDPDFVRQRFPMIYQNLLSQGIDMTKDRIPVYPCQHYLMGGIDVDLKARTSIDRLYAVGECSHTGVHGANRLASNSLLEALVFSHEAADDINARLTADTAWPEDQPFPAGDAEEEIPTGIRTEIRAIMQQSDFVIPRVDIAKGSIGRVQSLKELLDTHPYKVTPAYVEARSLATIAYLILKEVIQM